jgi:hypothetical protein
MRKRTQKKASKRLELRKQNPKREIEGLGKRREPLTRNKSNKTAGKPV